MLGVILPPWVHDGGTDKVLERLADKELRKKMVYDIEHGIPGWDNFVEFAGLDQIFVTSVKNEKNQDAVGLSLTQLGELRGIIQHRHPAQHTLFPQSAPDLFLLPHSYHH